MKAVATLAPRSILEPSTVTSRTSRAADGAIGELDHSVGGDARLAAGRRGAALDVLRELVLAKLAAQAMP